jgi:hypothetical protein
MISVVPPSHGTMRSTRLKKRVGLARLIMRLV